MLKRIGIVCSGGDSPGMNTGIAEAVARSLTLGIEPVGICRGFVGLVEGEGSVLTPAECLPYLTRGGCFLRTSRLPPGMTREELLDQSLAGCRRLKLEGLVVFGGNGSLNGLAYLAKHLPCAGIPATIDNDLAGSLLSIGFRTAVQHGVKALDELRDTAEALPGRLFTLQTLGGATGHLALEVAYAGQADAVLLPEVEETADSIVERARACLNLRQWFLPVVGEGSSWSAQLEPLLSEALGVRVRPTVLGHTQRGGTPLATDRLLARAFSSAAVMLLSHGGSGAVVWNGSGVRIAPLEQAAAARKIDPDQYAAVWRT